MSRIRGAGSGNLLSGPATRYVDRGYTRPAVLTLSGLAGLGVVVRQLL